MTSLYPKIPLFSTIEKPTRWRLTEISCETLSRSLQWRSSWKYQIWLKSHFILVINCHLGPLAHQNSTFHGTVYKVCHKGSFRYLEKNKTFNMLLFSLKLQWMSQNTATHLKQEFWNLVSIQYGSKSRN